MGQKEDRIVLTDLKVTFQQHELTLSGPCSRELKVLVRVSSRSSITWFLCCMTQEGQGGAALVRRENEMKGKEADTDNKIKIPTLS